MRISHIILLAVLCAGATQAEAQQASLVFEDPALNVRAFDVDVNDNLFLQMDTQVIAVSPSGRQHLVAGRQVFASSTGGVAALTRLVDIRDVHLGQSGTLYILEKSGVLRGVDSTGAIWTITDGLKSWGEPEAVFEHTVDSLYVTIESLPTFGGSSLLLISGGRVSRLAGIPGDDANFLVDGPRGDGGPAIDAALAEPRHLYVTPDGVILVAESFPNRDVARIRHIDRNGLITSLVAGRAALGLDMDLDGGVYAGILERLDPDHISRISSEGALDTVLVADVDDIKIAANGDLFFLLDRGIWRLADATVGPMRALGSFPDRAPPALLQGSPAGTRVRPDGLASIDLEFTEALDASASTASLTINGVPAPIDITWMSADTGLRIGLRERAPYGAEFLVVIDAVDIKGNGQELTYSFTTRGETLEMIASPSQGKAPLTVTFRAESTGGFSSFSWDFGDGTTAEGTTPTHVFRKIGRYTVRLSGVGDTGTITVSKTVRSNPQDYGKVSLVFSESGRQVPQAEVALTSKGRLLSTHRTDTGGQLVIDSLDNEQYEAFARDPVSMIRGRQTFRVTGDTTVVTMHGTALDSALADAGFFFTVSTDTLQDRDTLTIATDTPVEIGLYVEAIRGLTATHFRALVDEALLSLVTAEPGAGPEPNVLAQWGRPVSFWSDQGEQMVFKGALAAFSEHSLADSGPLATLTFQPSPRLGLAAVDFTPVFLEARDSILIAHLTPRLLIRSEGISGDPVRFDLDSQPGDQGLQSLDEIRSGDSVHVEVYVTPFAEVKDLEFEFHYDSEVLSLNTPPQPHLAVARHGPGSLTVTTASASAGDRETPLAIVSGTFMGAGHGRRQLNIRYRYTSVGPNGEVENSLVESLWLAGTSLKSADFDRNGHVDFSDFFLFAEAYGGSNLQYDLTGDGVVDIGDFFVFSDQFGQ